jgi:hypothetical protein
MSWPRGTAVVALLQWPFDLLGEAVACRKGGLVVVNKDLADLAYAAHAASRDSQLRPAMWDMLRTTAAVGSGWTRRDCLAGHTTGGRPSKVILTTVRHRIGCRVGRAEHASR